MTEAWRDKFAKVNNEVHGPANVCPGCYESNEACQELGSECRYCQSPPPHLGRLSGKTYICADCCSVHGETYNKHSFKTRGKGLEVGTPVHLVRLYVKGSGVWEKKDNAKNGMRGIVIGWMNSFHRVWV